MIPVAGLQAFTTIDYPGLLSCVVFLQGCPWRCRYCQNSELWAFDTKERPISTLLPWSGLLEFLQTRKSLLDAVVFSGGEATAHDGLADAMQVVKDLGFKVGLHTAGIYPQKLAKLLPRVDWVGFDLKAPLDERYDKITMVANSAKRVAESLKIVAMAGVAVQYRCTWHPLLLNEADLEAVRTELKTYDANAELVIQNFRTQGCQDQELVSLGNVGT